MPINDVGIWEHRSAVVEREFSRGFAKRWKNDAMILQFLKDHGVVFPTFREPTRKLALDYGTSMFPDTYVIDRHGKILRKFFSSQQWDSPDMLAYFDGVLGQT